MAKFKIDPTQILMVLAVASIVLLFIGQVFPNIVAFITSLFGDGGVTLQFQTTSLASVSELAKVLFAFIAMIIAFNLTVKSKGGFSRRDFFTMAALGVVLYYLWNYLTQFLGIENPITLAVVSVQSVLG